MSLNPFQEFQEMNLIDKHTNFSSHGNKFAKDLKVVQCKKFLAL